MNLAARLRKLREDKKMSLDEVARSAQISKTYLWELERDEAGAKKPSADVLLRIAEALSVSLADLLNLDPVRIDDREVDLPPGLRDLKERMRKAGQPIAPADLQDLARTKFRGAQPQTVDQWHQLYLLLLDSTMRRRKG
jgi:transcriptional regulator with XRE-family HTH domain